MDQQPITHESEGTDAPTLDDVTTSDRDHRVPDETIAREPEDRPDPEAADVDPAEIEADPPAGADEEHPVVAEEEDQPAPGTPGIPPPAKNTHGRTRHRADHHDRRSREGLPRPLRHRGGAAPTGGRGDSRRARRRRRARGGCPGPSARPLILPLLTVANPLVRKLRGWDSNPQPTD